MRSASKRSSDELKLITETRSEDYFEEEEEVMQEEKVNSVLFWAMYIQVRRSACSHALVTIRIGKVATL